MSSRLQAGEEVVNINEVAVSSSRREAVSLVKGSYKILRLVMHWTWSAVRGGSREEQPHLQEAAAAGRRRAESSYSTFKVRRGGREKIPLVQGKEQWLRFAEAVVKRYPTSKVRETQVKQ